jgi:UDP:flavonoid glycosyltransferase YjiC (YdhE family)
MAIAKYADPDKYPFRTKSLPDQAIYAGPELDDPDWVEPWNSPWPGCDPRPLILVGFSTKLQGQTPVLQRIIEALSMLNVRAVVTLGPTLPGEDLPWASNVFVCSSAPHNLLLQRAAAVVTHAGQGTVVRALAAGVPLLCMPMRRDQNGNSVRVVACGAGLRLSPIASVKLIRNAILELLEDGKYWKNAQKLSKRIFEDARSSSAVKILEEVAAAR